MKTTKLKRAKNRISFDTITKQYKKLNPNSKIGLITISNTINTVEFWDEFIIWFCQYFDKIEN